MGRRIRITNEIRSALTRAIDAAGSQSELSRLSGVPQKNLSNYISSANSLMNEATWVQLAPFLQDFLPQEKTAPQKKVGGGFVGMPLRLNTLIVSDSAGNGTISA